MHPDFHSMCSPQISISITVFKRRRARQFLEHDERTEIRYR